AAQVSADIGGEGLQRRDVHAPEPAARFGAQPVERREEGRQRFSGPRWRREQQVAAAGQGTPGMKLGGRRTGVAGPEPGPGYGAEGGERGLGGGGQRQLDDRGGILSHTVIVVS